MRKFKLIKEYPGSPGIGYTIDLNPEDNEMFESDHSFCKVTDYPKFWEEVIEKNYEILSFKHKGSGHIWKNDSQLKDTFCIVEGKAPFTSLEEINRYPKVYEIYSVKRLPDGEVFTIGDKIRHKNNVTSPTGIITCLHKVSLAMFVIVNVGIKGFDTNISLVDHYKEPLFTTEDNVDVFSGQSIFYIPSSKLPGSKLATVVLHTTASRGSAYTNHLYFSTKEAAEEYIIINKPCLSIHNISSNSNLLENSVIWHGLRDLVKSRIKNNEY